MQNIANLLDTPLSKIDINIEEYAIAIENSLENYIISPPKGIYVTGTLEPIIKDNLNYYNLIEGIFLLITDFNKVTGSVYNSDYKVIIPSYMMNNKSRFLYNTPTMPYVGIKICDLILTDYIYTSLMYNISKKYNTNFTYNYHISYMVSNYLLDTIYIEEVMNKCNSICSSLFNYIDTNIIFGNEWNIHLTYLNNNHILTIEKYCDWRIYDWYRLQERDLYI